MCAEYLFLAHQKAAFFWSLLTLSKHAFPFAEELFEGYETPSPTGNTLRSTGHDCLYHHFRINRLIRSKNMDRLFRKVKPLSYINKRRNIEFDTGKGTSATQHETPRDNERQVWLDRIWKEAEEKIEKTEKTKKTELSTVEGDNERQAW